MTDKAYIRVTMAEDGKTPIRELMVDGYKVCELSFVEVLQLIMQASSSLRWGREVVRVPIDASECAACAGEVADLENTQRGGATLCPPSSGIRIPAPRLDDRG